MPPITGCTGQPDRSGTHSGRILGMQYRWVRDRIFGAVRERLGGRVRLFVSGGAPLAPEIAEFFFTAGVLILEGYGLTETSPVVSVNRPESFGSEPSVVPLTMCASRLMVNCPSTDVMLGYWNQPDTTASLNKQGWLSTGDIGTLERMAFFGS